MSVGDELAGQPWRTPFVGRAPELALLVRQLDATVQGRGSVVLLAGEPGIGKTRIAEELCAIARQRGVTTLWGECLEGEGVPAFWPWVQILSGWARTQSPADVRKALGLGAVDIAQIVPEVRARLPKAAEQVILEPTQARFRLFDSIVKLLRRMATGPLLLVLDDLHWADEPSLGLLELASSQLVDAPLLIVGGYRDVEVAPGHRLSSTLGGLVRRAHVQRIELGRLSPDEVAQFVSATPGVNAAALLAQTVLDRAEGNPLFVGELLRLLQSEPGARTHRSSSAFAVPPTIRDVVGRRLSRLSEGCRRVLTVAAVVGRDFDTPTLRAVLGDDHHAVLEALEETEAIRIVEPVRGAGPAFDFRFTHALVQDTIYASLSAGQRARLHLQVGEALEALPEAARDARLTELAHHFVQAAAISPPARVLGHVRRAAQRAARLFAFEEAARLYSLALRLLDAGALEQPELRCDLLLRLGTVQSWLADDAASHETFVAAAEQARQLGPLIGAGRAAHLLGQAALGYAGAARQEYRSPDARGVSLLVEALAAVGPGDSADRARLLARLGSAAIWPQPVADVMAIRQEAIGVARRVGDDQALVDALFSHYHGMTIAEPRDTVPARCDEVQRLVRRIGSSALLMDSQRWRIKTALELGDLAAADAETAAYARLLHDHRQPQAAWRLAVTRMSRALLIGDLAGAERAAEEAGRLGPSRPRYGMPWYASGELHLLRFDQGRLAEAEALLDEIRQDYPRTNGPRWARAWVLSERGILDEARRELDAVAANDFAELRIGGRWNYSITFVAHLCANLGDRARAALLYDLLLPQARFNVVSGVTFASYGAAAYCMGRLAATIGWKELAAGHFEDAITLHTRLRAEPLLARTRAHYAAAVLDGRASGSAASARTLAQAALDAASSLGMAGLREHAAALLERCAPAAPAAPPPRHDRVGPPSDPLTARELEILALLAGGASNAQIGRTLGLSPGTVHWYTVRIYQKIAVSGRAEAAAYAARQGLLGRPD